MVILFKPYHVPMILAGNKTQTRRKWKRPRVKVGNVYQARTALFGKSFAHLRVKRIHHEILKDISEADARAEGYAGRHAFITRWEMGFGKASDLVWAVEFERVAGGKA